MKNHLIFLLIPLSFLTVYPQIPERTHILNDYERSLMQRYVYDFSETPPPDGEVRGIAEWEDMQAVIIAYTGTFGIPVSLIAEMSEDTEVLTIVANTNDQNTVQNIYANNGVNTANCSYLIREPDTYWTRDYSAWFIGIDDSEIAVVDFPYNRPRPNDDGVPAALAEEMGLARYGMNVIHTGGNYMCDGYGIAASTDLVWEENPDLTQAGINQKMQDYLGIDTYHVLPDPLDDYIKHIDCWGKFLDVDKVLITQVPASDYRYEDYEAVADYFATHNCSWGYPYEVIRVQAADYYDYDVNPYTNSLILNDKVFVPLTGSSLDAQAIAVYEQAMPGYEITGVYSDDWINSDALHCRTHGIADPGMLHIRHYPLHGEVTYQNSFEIQADVFSYGGSPVAEGYPILYYRQDGGQWQSSVMNYQGEGHAYTSQIPAVEDGVHEVEYYLKAVNENGKVKSLPRMGAADPFVFQYSGTAGLTGPAVHFDLQLYPNPAAEYCMVNTAGERGTITVYNAEGRLITVQDVEAGKHRLDVETYTRGVYWVAFTNPHIHSIRKLVVK